MGCCVCGDDRVVAKDRCAPCYRQWHRTGADRTEAQVARAAERALHRQAPDAGWMAALIRRKAAR